MDDDERIQPEWLEGLCDDTKAHEERMKRYQEEAARDRRRLPLEIFLILLGSGTAFGLNEYLKHAHHQWWLDNQHLSLLLTLAGCGNIFLSFWLARKIIK